jgi:acyl-CoA reductase-like NAD-dependent aldehyde dehydrogenase
MLRPLALLSLTLLLPALAQAAPNPQRRDTIARAAARVRPLPGGTSGLREAFRASRTSADGKKALESYLAVRGGATLPSSLLPSAVTSGKQGAVARYLIAGEYRTSRTIDAVLDPIDGQRLVGVYATPRKEILEAIDKAHAARPRTAALPVETRARILRQVANELKARRAELGQLIALEAGKPLADALTEVDRAVSTFRLAATEATRLKPRTQHVKGGGDLRVERVPLGVVTAITPFNFPLNLVAHKVAPAIAAGDPILLKPSQRTPLTALALAEIISKTAWPKEALSVLTPRVSNIAPLVKDPRVRMVSFTGSEPVGWKLKQQASDKRVALELGGNAAVIVHRDADLADAVKKSVRGGFAYSGQVCIHTQRILVHEAVYDQFVAEMVKQTAQLKMGDPLLAGTQVGPLIDRAAVERTKRWIDEAVAGGARVLTGGKVTGNYLQPTVVVGARPGDKIVSEEVFGPVVVISRYSALDRALSEVNSSRFGLQAGVFSRDPAVIQQAYRALEVGGVVANHVPTIRFDAQPYGGVKRSGFGREGPRYAIEEMTEYKALVMP